MKITVTTRNGEAAQLNVEPNTSMLMVKAVVEAELRVPAGSQRITFNGVPLEDTATVQSAGIREDDILLIEASNQRARTETLEDIPQELFRSPAKLQEYIRARPQLLQQLLHVNPTFAEAVLAPDPSFLEALISQQAQERQRRQMEEMKELEALNADPFNPENQKKIAEAIRRQNIQENMERAIEHAPEAFGRVVMLYVPCRVNGQEIVAFVDSGAQSTIMSQRCAERCGLMKLLDERFAGLAKGVGTAKILGRIHATHLTIGKSHFEASITVIQNQDIDFLFGLDQLKRHQACIDLRDNVLRIGDETIPFLSEKDLPSHIRTEDSGQTPSSSSSHSDSSSGSTSSPPVSTLHPPIGSTASRSPSTSAPSSSSTSSSSTTNVSGSRLVSQQGTSGSTAPRTSPPSQSSPSLPVLPPVHNQTINPNANPASSRPAPFAEDKIQRIMNLGFTRPQVIQALQSCGGNEDLAASMLFASQFGNF